MNQVDHIEFYDIKDLDYMEDKIVQDMYVFIECKNYQTEIANKETYQLSGRFSSKRGKKENEENLIKRCQKLIVDKDEYIIPLNDEDIIYYAKL